jgi:hypothetical protein
MSGWWQITDVDTGNHRGSFTDYTHEHTEITAVECWKEDTEYDRDKNLIAVFEPDEKTKFAAWLDENIPMTANLSADERNARYRDRAIVMKFYREWDNS